LKTNKVLVIGDIILDKYIKGSVSRISPEAPIPVIKIDSEEYSLGGAANVANNLESLGCEVSIIGMIGLDIAGKKLKQLFLQRKIHCYFNYSKNYKSITKTRIIGNNQQITRLDYNDDIKPDSLSNYTMIETFKDVMDPYDVVVISDYNKGVCTNRMCRTVINLCNQKNKIVIVDPKGNDWDKYRKATMITPNLKETSELIGNKIKNTNLEIRAKCNNLHDQVRSKYLLITRSERGMSLISKDSINHIPSRAKEVFDVTGAGDTVVATIAAFINRDNALGVVIAANKAAGIVVSKVGTSTITQKELDRDPIADKIMFIDSLSNQIKIWKDKKETIVFTNGCFDLLHKGHIHSIQKASELGTRLIVAINSDNSVKKIKGINRPINNEYDRAYVIASHVNVDAVIIFNEITPENILKIIKPNILVKGGDYTIDEIVGREYADKVEIIDYLDGYSTTKIVEKIEGE
jgi:D-beta-D-heptose 7-phosphate kinase/D-beta-D-heptose 1-phosphate adenosyltransferase